MLLILLPLLVLLLVLLLLSSLPNNIPKNPSFPTRTPASIELSASPSPLRDASELRGSVQQGFLERWPQLRSWADALCGHKEKAQDELMYWETYLGNPGLCPGFFLAHILDGHMREISPSFFCVGRLGKVGSAELLSFFLTVSSNKPSISGESTGSVF